MIEHIRWLFYAMCVCHLNIVLNAMIAALYIFSSAWYSKRVVRILVILRALSKTQGVMWQIALVCANWKYLVSNVKNSAWGGNEMKGSVNFTAISPLDFSISRRNESQTCDMGWNAHLNWSNKTALQTKTAVRSQAWLQPQTQQNARCCRSI